LPAWRGGLSRAPQPPPEPSMSRYAAPLGFALVAIWIAVVFVLVSGTVA
jgi:hypothetical protein